MRRKLLVGLVLVLAALAVLVAFFPAAWAWDMARGRQPQLDMRAVHGSIWRGQAGAVRYAGMPLGSLEWRVSPTALLGGHLHVDLTLQGPLAVGQASLTRAGPSMIARDMRLEVRVSALPFSLGSPPMHPRGRLLIDIPRLVLKGRWPRQLEGRVTWRDAALAEHAGTLSLGDLHADLGERAGSVLQARLSDAGGPVALSGMIKVSPLGWRLDAVLHMRHDTPLARRVLGQLGRFSPDGSLRLDRSGGLTMGGHP